MNDDVPDHVIASLDRYPPRSIVDEMVHVGDLRFHPVLFLRWEEGGPIHRYCGYTWCCGECGLPALVIEKDGRKWKAHGTMAACGPVMNTLYGGWDGKIEHVPTEYEKEFFRKMWR